MRNGCVSSEEIGAILRLPPDSPERQHLEACPRCRALLISYREFVEDRSSPPGANLQDAGAHLREAFDETVAGRTETVKRPAWWTFTRWVPRLPLGLGRAWLLAPVTMLVVLGLYAGFGHLRRESGPDRLRGPAATEPGRGQGSILLLEARPQGTEAVELRWRAIPAASSYEVVVFGTDLKDLARLRSLTDTLCVVRRADLHPEPGAGALLGWQVFAQRDGVTVASSPIGAVRLP